MVDFLQNQTPQKRPLASANHVRSQSSPYFQHTRTFSSDGSNLPYDSTPVLGHMHIPTTSSHVRAIPIRPSPARLQKHNRSHTETTIPRPPLVTTNIKIESAPAVLASSIFSGSSPIKFDLSPPQSPRLSPEKERWSFIPSFRADKGLPERSPSPLRMSTWFQGESAPVSFGITSAAARDTSDPILQSSPTLTETSSVVEPTMASKGNNFFSSFFTSKAVSAIPIQKDDSQDEFFNLDIKQALQPHGQADPFSPSSFKNLQQNAEGLLARMQLAYRQRVLAINNVKAEQEAQEEEFEEAQTRAHHLKSQLDSLSSCLDDRNKEIQRLSRQLQEEKRLRQEEADRNRTIRVVDENQPFDRRTRSRNSLLSTTSTSSMFSDAETISNEGSDPFRHEQSPITSSPITPASVGWLHNYQCSLSDVPKGLEQITHIPTGDISGLILENGQLRSRVGHLEKELDNCLEILQGFGL